jgi:hypothetical protein
VLNTYTERQELVLCLRYGASKLIKLTPWQIDWKRHLCYNMLC